MIINAINPVKITYGSRQTEAMSKENNYYSNSFRRIFHSPIYDDGLIDTDEMSFRRGVEDFHSETVLRTMQENEDNFFKGVASVSPAKEKSAQITTAEQARNVEKFISELDFLKLSNPSEAFSIGGQISRLKQMLRRYYKVAGKVL